MIPDASTRNAAGVNGSNRNEPRDTVEGIRFAMSTVPQLGEPTRVCDGIWMIRLPFHGSLDHVNVYLIEDTDGWVLVDTGANLPEVLECFQRILKLPRFETGIHSVIVTHYHPDHIGFAGHFASQGATLWTSQTAWLHAKLLQQDKREVPNDEQVRFMRCAGLQGIQLAAYQRHAPSNYPQSVLPIPFQYRRIQEADVLAIGERKWRVVMGNGHAYEHVTLWSDDGIALTGDQILAGTAANLAVHASEPAADPVQPWLESCHRFYSESDDQWLCLAGHNLPFYGIRTRCKQYVDSLETTLNRLLQNLQRPLTTLQCVETIYRRKPSESELKHWIAESAGYLNHLTQFGYVQAMQRPDGVSLWKSTTAAKQGYRPSFAKVSRHELNHFKTKTVSKS